MIPPDPPVTSVASPAPRRTAPENSGRAGRGASRPAASAHLPQRYLTRRHPPTPHGCLDRGKSPVKTHSHPLPGQRERQRTLSVSDPLTLPDPVNQSGVYLFSEREKYDNMTPPQTPPVRRLSLRLISRHRLAVKSSLTATAPGSSPAIAWASRLVCQPDLVEPAATPDCRRPADPPKPSGVSRRRGNPVCALWDTTKSWRGAWSVGADERRSEEHTSELQS